MAVLMSYHKLVERDSKHVDYCWKCATICILILAIISCFAGSLSLQKLVLAYDDHCILGADVKFKEKVDDSNSTSLNSAFSESNSMSLSEFFTPTFASRLSPMNDETYPVEQLKILDGTQIDIQESNWANHSTCDFAIFIPIFQCCFGIIITVMFIICGKGGKAEQSSFLPQPWRIVTPSLIFFLIMECISIANITTIHSGMEQFCKGFQAQTPNVGCMISMNNFALKDVSVIAPSIFYILLLTFSWILLISWLVLLSIMIARILFVIDFQLVRVTIKTCENGSEGKTKYQVIEPQEEEKDGNAGNSSEC